MNHRIRVAAILIEDNKILLVRHVHPKTEFEWWVPPGGGIERTDENLYGCAIRETWEETGYHIETGEIVYIREFFDLENDTLNLEIFIKGKVIGGEITLKNIQGNGSDEFYIKEVRWIDRVEAEDLMIYPEVIKTDEFWKDIKSNNKFIKYLDRQEG